MRPGFVLGSVVVLKRVPVSSMAQGDVILFHRLDDPAKLVVHRIYSMTTKHGIVETCTKRDDTPELDAWTGRYAYQAEFAVPSSGTRPSGSTRRVAGWAFSWGSSAAWFCTGRSST